MTDDERLQEIRARVEAATHGPWEHRVTMRTWNTAGLDQLKDSPTLADTAAREHQVVTSWIHGQVKDHVAIFAIGVSWCFETPYAIHVRSEDAEFVAHSREDVPWLLARLDAERVEKEQWRALADAATERLITCLGLVEPVMLKVQIREVLRQFDALAASSMAAGGAGE